MSSFYLSHHVSQDDVCVIRVGGYLDFDAAPEFKKCLVHRIEEGSKVIVVDLTDAGFIDSTGIGVLVGALKRVKQAGGSLAVVCADADVRGIFEIVGLDAVMPLHGSREEALAAVAAAV